MPLPIFTYSILPLSPILLYPVAKNTFIIAELTHSSTTSLQVNGTQSTWNPRYVVSGRTQQKTPLFYCARLFPRESVYRAVP
jgi:hypothetical protein